MVEKKKNLTYAQMRALERKARGKKPKAKPKAKLDWRQMLNTEDAKR
jgi:hypothetical protein